LFSAWLLSSHRRFFFSGFSGEGYTWLLQSREGNIFNNLWVCWKGGGDTFNRYLFYEFCPGEEGGGGELFTGLFPFTFRFTTLLVRRAVGGDFWFVCFFFLVYDICGTGGSQWKFYCSCFTTGFINIPCCAHARKHARTRRACVPEETRGGGAGVHPLTLGLDLKFATMMPGPTWR